MVFGNRALLTGAVVLTAVLLGFVVAGLLTEPWEERVAPVPTEDGVGFEPAIAVGSQTILKFASIAAGTVAALWAAVYASRRGRPLLSLGLSCLGGTIPAWYALYEWDHVEGIVGASIAMSVAWLLVTRASGRTFAAVGVIVHVLANVISTAGNWEFASGFVLLGYASLVGLLLALRAPHPRARAALTTIGPLALLAGAAWWGWRDLATAGDGVAAVLVLGLLVLVAATFGSRLRWREADPAPGG